MVHAATGVAATDVAAPEVAANQVLAIQVAVAAVLTTEVVVDLSTEIAATGVVEGLATEVVAAAADDESLGVVVSVFQIVWVVVGIEVVADCWTSNHPLCLAKH